MGNLPRRPRSRMPARLALVLVGLWAGLTLVAMLLHRPAPRAVVELPAERFFRRERVTALTYTPDGTVLLVATAYDRRDGGDVVADTPGYEHYWDVTGDRPRWGSSTALGPAGHGLSGPVRQLAFSPDGAGLALVANDLDYYPRVEVRASQGGDRYVYHGDKTVVRDIDPAAGELFAPDGSAITFSRVATEAVREEGFGTKEGAGGQPFTLTRWVHRPTLHVWDTALRKERFTVPGGRSPAFAPDAATLACWKYTHEADGTGFGKKALLVRDARTGRPRNEFRYEPNDGFSHGGIGPLLLPGRAGPLLALAGDGFNGNLGRGQVWDSGAGTVVAEVKGGYPLGVSGDREWVVLTSRPDWGPKPPDWIETRRPPAVYRTGDLQASGHPVPRRVTALLPADRGAGVIGLEPLRSPDGWVAGAGRWLGWAAAGVAAVGWYDLASGDARPVATLDHQPTALAIRPDGEEVAVVVRPSAPESDRIELYPVRPDVPAGVRFRQAALGGLRLTGVLAGAGLLALMVWTSLRAARRWLSPATDGRA